MLVNKGNGRGCWHPKCTTTVDGDVEVTECLECHRVWHRTRQERQVWEDLMYSNYADPKLRFA